MSESSATCSRLLASPPIYHRDGRGRLTIEPGSNEEIDAPGSRLGRLPGRSLRGYHLAGLASLTLKFSNLTVLGSVQPLVATSPTLTGPSAQVVSIALSAVQVIPSSLTGRSARA